MKEKNKTNWEKNENGVDKMEWGRKKTINNNCCGLEVQTADVHESNKINKLRFVGYSKCAGRSLRTSKTHIANIVCCFLLKIDSKQLKYEFIYASSWAECHRQDRFNCGIDKSCASKSTFSTLLQFFSWSSFKFGMHPTFLYRIIKFYWRI